MYAQYIRKHRRSNEVTMRWVSTALIRRVYRAYTECYLHQCALTETVRSWARRIMCSKGACTASIGVCMSNRFEWSTYKLREHAVSAVWAQWKHSGRSGVIFAAIWLYFLQVRKIGNNKDMITLSSRIQFSSSDIGRPWCCTINTPTIETPTIWCWKSVLGLNKS